MRRTKKTVLKLWDIVADQRVVPTLEEDQKEGRQMKSLVADLSPHPRHLYHTEIHSQMYSAFIRVRATKHRYSSNVMSSRVG